MMWNFGGDPCVAVISIKLESSFVEIALLHGFSPVDLLHDFRIIFLEEHSGGLPLNTDNFIYTLHS